MPRPHLSFRADWQGDQARLSVGGEIDLLTAASLVETAGGLLGRNPATLVLDLAQVTFCDSAGVAALVKIYHQAATVSAQLRVRGAGDMVRHVLEISGVDRVIPVDDSPVG
ncbi:MAG TPA: STAS domain-containing protein [Rugosimonospora sp.]|nr:STAS domain-containing protein [Rugosimonospora sp.]